ncbi:MAG: hypothetical protein Q9198_008908, partial [Flavoplaca austrocitrina]
NGHEKVVRILVDHGAKPDISECGWTPMLLAAKHGRMMNVKILVKVGVEVNAEDYYGRRALHWVARCGDEAMLRLLIEKGADLDVVDDWGRTALMWAIENKQHTITKLLLARGAHVDGATLDGSTALHLAAFLQDEELVRQLLDNGSRIEAKTRTGFSALHVAFTVGCMPIIQLLLDRGADLEAEAQWRPDADEEQNDTERWYEYDEKAANFTGLKSVDKSIHGLLVSSGWEVKNQEREEYKLTPRQLAANRQVFAKQEQVA